MDFSVEATVHLNNFHNETKVREILRSHGFALTDLSSDQVRVNGSFLKLKAAKASLEQLLNSQTKTDITPVQQASSGAISKHYTNSSSGGTRSRLGSRNKPPDASPSSPTTSPYWKPDSSNNYPTSPEYRASFSRPDERGSFRPGRESFVVDADVLMYARRLRERDIDGILDSHNVKMEEHQVGDSVNISLLGKSGGAAVFKLQSLLNDLSKSLRTQEVPLKDMCREGGALLERIQKNKDIHNLVLVCAMKDKLHLIGPSGESYELKQRLLGRPVDQSGRTGRTLDKNSRRRSSSLPPPSRKSADKDGGAIAYPSPAGAAGYSPSKYQDDKQERAEPKQVGALGRRSQSESRKNTQAVTRADPEFMQKPPKTPKKAIKDALLLLDPRDIKKRLKEKRQ